jgi:F-type H+-transporting ATPase subunit a
MFSILAADDPMQHIMPHEVMRIGDFIITNQMLMAVVAALLMILLFPTLFRKATAEAPTGACNFFETILSYLREEVFRPALKDKTDRFVPFLWTLFFFILFCNLLGQIPIGEVATLITGKASHLGGTATGNINATGGLALCTLLMIHFSGMVQVARELIAGTHGHHEHAEQPRGKGDPVSVDSPHIESGKHPVGRTHGMNPLAAIVLAPPLYLWNFAPHPFKPQHGQNPLLWLIDVPMWAGLLVLELIGALIKPFALMIRLFANMIAGHLVLAVLIGFIAAAPTIGSQIGISLPVIPLVLLIRLLELFVAFLQAYIFTFLTTLFIAAAVAPEH